MRYAYLNISCVKARIYLCGLVKYTTDTPSTTALGGNRLNAIKLRALHVGLPLQIVMSCRGNPLWLPSPKSGTIWHWEIAYAYALDSS